MKRPHRTALIALALSSALTFSATQAQTPDLEAKLAEEQTPRGWGLFLIRNLVDEMRVTSDEHHHTIELIMSREEEDDANQSA